jgi:NitT/TauT family transport system permease protein
MTSITQTTLAETAPAEPIAASHGNRLSRSGLVTRWLKGRAAPLVTAVVTVVLWEWIVSTGLPPSSIAAPTEAWSAFAEDPGNLGFHVVPTMTAALTGFGVATSLALLVSLVTVIVPRTTSLIYNASVVTYSVPLIALAPVLLVWIGNGPSLRITIAAIAGFFPVVVGCIQGFNSTDAARMELMEQLSASRLSQFRLLTVPEALPYIFAGLKVAAASAVLGAIISEWSGADRGLGLAMINALSGYKPGDLWMIIIASTFLTLSLYSIVGLVERLVIRWDYDQDAVAARS